MRYFFLWNKNGMDMSMKTKPIAAIVYDEIEKIYLLFFEDVILNKLKMQQKTLAKG